MIAEFYILNHSFKYPENLSISELEERLKLFAENCEYIRKHDSEKTFVHDSIYEEVIYEEIQVMDLMYNPKYKQNFDRDTLENLRTIIDKSQNTDYEADDIKELLGEHSEDEIYGLLCLHQTNFVEEIYLIYNQRNWLDFHRYFLSIYPKNSTFFIDECTKYFPNLYFHPRNKETVSKILAHFAIKIVYHLSCLNDYFQDIRAKNSFLADALEVFSTQCNLDTKASLEGKASRKKNLTFRFINHQNQEEEVCCEPHLKLSKSDNVGDSKHYQHRIYFHEGKAHIQKNKILIGHIGEHL